MGASTSAQIFLRKGRPAWDKMMQERKRKKITSEIDDLALWFLQHADPIIFPDCCSPHLETAWHAAELDRGPRANYKRMCAVLEQDRREYNTALAVLRDLKRVKEGKKEASALKTVILDVRGALSVVENEIEKLAFAFAVSVASRFTRKC